MNASSTAAPDAGRCVPAPGRHGRIGVGKSSCFDLAGPAPWWVVRTRPRCEKKMDGWLASHGCPRYLPTRPKARAYPSKTVVFHHPLFPGYAFGAFPLSWRRAVLGSGYAAGVIDVVHQSGFLEELAAIQRALDASLPIDDAPLGYLKRGATVRITAGPLRGSTGVLQRVGHRHRLVLSVDVLQRSIAVEIDPAWVELAA